MLLEICCGNVESAQNAELAGAKRIELCRDLPLGGLTPSHQDILYCKENLSFNTFVLIRPRGGDFNYCEAEFQEILADISFCREIGIPGVVIGFLDTDFNINIDYCRRAIWEAGNMQVTFHRAFDRCKDWPTALEQIIDSGFSRILTSGQQPTAPQGADTLAQIVKQAADRITILAGSGVTSDNVTTLIQKSGVPEVHASCKLNGQVSDINEIKKILTLIA